MDSKLQMEEQIMGYIDGLLQAREKQEVENRLLKDPEWQRCYQDMLDLDHSLRAVSLEEPSMRFTRNVMDQVQSLQIAPSTRSYVNKKIIWAISGFFLLLIVVPLIVFLPQVDFSQVSSNPLPVKLPSFDIDWTRYLNSTVLQVFFIIDAVAALFFLDRYLQRRKARLQAGTSQ